MRHEADNEASDKSDYSDDTLKRPHCHHCNHYSRGAGSQSPLVNSLKVNGRTKALLYSVGFRLGLGGFLLGFSPVQHGIRGSIVGKFWRACGSVIGNDLSVRLEHFAQ
jgi:hypothetical protein